VAKYAHWLGVGESQIFTWAPWLGVLLSGAILGGWRTGPEDAAWQSAERRDAAMGGQST